MKNFFEQSWNSFETKDYSVEILLKAFAKSKDLNPWTCTYK